MNVSNSPPSAFRTMWREIYKDKIAFIGLILFCAIMISTFIIAAALDEDTVLDGHLANRNLAPSAQFILGTDEGGRGMIGMLILGARNSLLVGFTVTILSKIIGISIGLVSGFYGGHTDNAIMRVMDTWLMLPSLMCIIVFITVIPNYTVVHFVLVMTAFSWMGTARIIRAMALAQRNLDYVSASKTLGTRNIVIMLREVLPNLVPVITVNLTLSLAANIGIETGLTFLGFGLPFGTPSLGALLSHALAPYNLQFRMWQWLPAALLIFILMLCIYSVGQALSRAADVRQRKV
ncbi:MAG: ABC transporter permease [Treponema sp.]|nr:ABC transporter permease [Treponema sp.]